VLFDRATSSTSDLRFTAVDTTGPFRGAVISGNHNRWTLTRTDGLSYFFSGRNQYDRMELLQSITDRHGNRITLVRQDGPVGHIVQIISPNGRWIKLTWQGGAGGHVTRAEDSAGRVVQYQYDGPGRLTGAIRPDGNETHYAYDGAHRMTGITDARGIAYVTNTYDAAGRVATQTVAGEGTYTFAYQTSGSTITKTTVTDPAGVVTETTFGADRRVVAQTSAVGTPQQKTVPLVRDPITRLPQQVSDPSGTVTAFSYNGTGEVTGVTTRAGTPRAETTSIEPGGPYGQVRSVTTPTGRTTRLAYDGVGNVTAVTDAAERTSQYTHNDQGQVTTIRNHLGLVTTLSYDRGDLVAVTDAAGQTTRRLVDAAGRLLVSTDALGAQTRTSYDANGNVTAVVHPLGATTSFTYDANGNITGVTDARGHTSTATFDNADRLTQITDPLGNTETRTYDAVGQVTTSTDRRGKATAVQYDRIGRVMFIGFGATAGPTYESTVAYAYDSKDRLATITDSVDGTTTLGYDDRDQVISVTSALGTVGYSYDDEGRRIGMAVPGQQPISYAYDDETGHLASMTQGTTVVTWNRDDAGRVTSITQPGLTRSYTYDGLSRVSTLRYNTTGGAEIGRLTYGYDRNGRVADVAGSMARVTIPITGPPATYDAANRLTARGGETFAYDDAGNLVDDGTRSYEWNARGELAEVTGPGLSASFAYDPAGRRRSSTVNGATTTYLYDENNLVQERVGGTATANRLVAALDQTLQVTDASGTYIPVTDPLGSTLGLVTATGAMSTTYTYEPYGAVTAAGATSPNTRQFAGAEYDAATGLTYHRARYYSPGLARFISQDPAGIAGGSTNLYTYALGDPTNLSDPFGDCPICAVLAVGCVIGGLFSLSVGMGLSDLLDRKYTWKDGFNDFALGCAMGAFTEGLGATLRGAYGAAGALGGFSAGTRAVGAAAGGTAGATGAARPGSALVPKAAFSLGQWGEARLAQILGGRGFKPAKPFKTSLGPRYVDRVIGRTAYEAKAGVDVKLTSAIQRQIDKDAELLATGQFDEIVWYFFQGASKDLLDELTANGIRYVLVP
jgi:RHS repeat-associated protein